MTNYVQKLRADLKQNADPEAKASLQRLFKESIKQYGMKTAVVNRIAKQHLAQIKKDNLDKTAVYAICNELWLSGFQEEALVACVLSESQHKNYSSEDFEIFAHWVHDCVSNWAMCDTLCNHTIGDLLMMYPQLADRLLEWTVSENRWVKRAAAVTLIIPARKGFFIPLVFRIADALLTDNDDMVQKGYGWMLKATAESSEHAQQAVFDYVMANKTSMPRIALRYAIEKMPVELKQQAMAKK